MTKMLAHIDGRVIPMADAKVPLADRGYLFGDGVFETLRTREGRIINLDSHERRMRGGLEVIGLREDVAEEAMGAALQLAAAGATEIPGDLYLRVQVTTGITDEFLGERDTWRVTGLAKPLPAPQREHVDPGLTLDIVPQIRNTRDPLAKVKSTSYLSQMTARRTAKALGVDDGILLNEHGRVAEVSTSNLFAVVEHELYSPGPAEGALDGTTRQALLETGLGMPVHEELTLKQLHFASEVFITNAIRGVLPARSGPGRPDLAGANGDVFKRVREVYRREILGD